MKTEAPVQQTEQVTIQESQTVNQQTDAQMSSNDTQKSPTLSTPEENKTADQDTKKIQETQEQNKQYDSKDLSLNSDEMKILEQMIQDQAIAEKSENGSDRSNQSRSSSMNSNPKRYQRQGRGYHMSSRKDLSTDNQKAESSRRNQQDYDSSKHGRSPEQIQEKEAPASSDEDYNDYPQEYLNHESIDQMFAPGPIRQIGDFKDPEPVKRQRYSQSTQRQSLNENYQNRAQRSQVAPYYQGGNPVMTNTRNILQKRTYGDK